MPTITVFTDDNNLANNVAEYKPFTVGDATDAWTLKFHNGTSFFAPSGVSMRVGHVNGLPNGTYNSAFTWTDRYDNDYTPNITVSGGIPSISGTPTNGSSIGGSGVYILNGEEPTNVGQITNIAYASTSSGSLTGNYAAGTSVTFTATGAGRGFIATGRNTSSSDGGLDTLSLISGGADYTAATDISSNVVSTNRAILTFDVKSPRYQVPFLSATSGLNIIAATTLSPFSDGEIQDTTEFNSSTLVIRPRDIATASLSQSGTDYVGTMNPINDYVTARLALRGSTQIDLQIFGDNQMLFQGKLTILNKIA
mgnify:CR=1 FL=1|tara:strand:+ start:2473 stop:3402 length:930 start_codon:yes stop_codon:yes gene_type:complete